MFTEQISINTIHEARDGEWLSRKNRPSLGKYSLQVKLVIWGVNLLVFILKLVAWGMRDEFESGPLPLFAHEFVCSWQSVIVSHKFNFSQNQPTLPSLPPSTWSKKSLISSMCLFHCKSWFSFNVDLPYFCYVLYKVICRHSVVQKNKIYSNWWNVATTRMIQSYFLY